LLYLMVLMVVNASCTNYVLAYTNGFVGFWGLFAIRWLQHHDRIRNKLWSIAKKAYGVCTALSRRVQELIQKILTWCKRIGQSLKKFVCRDR